MRQPYRIAPLLPAAAMKTYEVALPRRSHWRPATCQEVGCQHYQHGWATTVLPESGDEAAIRASGRAWARRERVEGGFVRYVFAPGTICFAAGRHVLPLERPAIYRVRGGDWRGNPRGIPTRTHVRAGDFVEDWALHQQELADGLAQG